MVIGLAPGLGIRTVLAPTPGLGLAQGLKMGPGLEMERRAVSS